MQTASQSCCTGFGNCGRPGGTDPRPHVLPGCVGGAGGRCGLPRALHPDDLVGSGSGPGTLGCTLLAAGTRPGCWCVAKAAGTCGGRTKAWYPILHYPLSITFQLTANGTSHEDALDRVLRPGRLRCLPADLHPSDVAPLQPANLHCLLPPSATAPPRSDCPCPTLRAPPRHNLALALRTHRDTHQPDGFGRGNRVSSRVGADR